MNAPSLKTHLKLSSPIVNRLTDLWRWWIDELAGILPRGVRSATRPSMERLYLQANGSEVIVSQGTSETMQEIGCYPLSEESLTQDQLQALEELAERSREVVVYLPESKILTKTLTLPLVAESNLREVLGFEMDRQTPFSLDQVYYDFILGKRDSKSSTLSVDLVVTPRTYLDDLLSKLNDIGFKPHKVTFVDKKSSDARPVNLLPVDARQQQQDSAGLLNLVLGLLALALFSATIALPLMNKFQLIDRLETRIESATRKAEVIQRLNEEVEQLSTGSDFLVKKKQLTPLTLEIIDELTRILPDDTWINQLTIKGTEIQIQGFSTAAATLIPLIESSDRLHNPRFRSSVTTAQNSDSERFHLSAEVIGRPSR